MKKLLAAVAASLLLAPLFLLTAGFTVSGCARPVPPPYYAPPPPDAIAHRGFDAGVEAARRDISSGRRPRVDRHPRFRMPPVPPGEPAAIYRRNFRRGYEETYRGGH